MTCNLMVIGHVEKGHDNDAIFFYEQMHGEGINASGEIALANTVHTVVWAL